MVSKDKQQLEASKRYEQAFQAITHHHRQELGYGWVEGSKFYPGKLSQESRERQIDATIHLPDGELILVECRQRTSAILNIHDVEAFDAKVRIDIEISGAMIVSTNGFTQAAINYARNRAIWLVTLNWAATADEYVMKIDNNTLMGFLETVNICEQVSFNGEIRLADDKVQISEEISFQSIPKQGNLEF